MVNSTGLQCMQKTCGSLLAADACLLQCSIQRGQVWACNMPNRWSVATGLCGCILDPWLALAGAACGSSGGRKAVGYAGSPDWAAGNPGLHLAIDKG